MNLPVIPIRLPDQILFMARQHQVALDQLEELTCGLVRPVMDDVGAAVILLGANFQLLVQELENLT